MKSIETELFEALKGSGIGQEIGFNSNVFHCANADIYDLFAIKPTMSEVWLRCNYVSLNSQDINLIIKYKADGQLKYVSIASERIIKVYGQELLFVSPSNEVLSATLRGEARESSGGYFMPTKMGSWLRDYFVNDDLLDIVLIVDKFIGAHDRV